MQIIIHPFIIILQIFTKHSLSVPDTDLVLKHKSPGKQCACPHGVYLVAEAANNNKFIKIICHKTYLERIKWLHK